MDLLSNQNQQNNEFIQNKSILYVDFFKLPVSAIVMDSQGDLLLCNQSALDFFAVRNLCELIVNKRLFVLNNMLLKSIIDDLSTNGEFSNRRLSVGLYQNSKPSRTEVKCSAVKLIGENRQRLFIFMF